MNSDLNSRRVALLVDLPAQLNPIGQSSDALGRLACDLPLKLAGDLMGNRPQFQLSEGAAPRRTYKADGGAVYLGNLVGG